MVNPPQPRNQPPSSPRVSQSSLSAASNHSSINNPNSSKPSPSMANAQLHNQQSQQQQYPSHHTHPHLHHVSTNSSQSSNASVSSQSSSNFHHAPSQQQQQPHHHHSHSHSVSHGSNHPSRKPSIVELLSSPPPLPIDQDDSIHHLSLSRNPSISSRTSQGSINPFNHHLHHHPSNSSTERNASITTAQAPDWSDIPLTEIVESNKLISIHASHSVQSAFETLVKNDLTSVPVSISKDDPTDLRNCLTFDYSDLNTYLLLIMNKIDYSELNVDEIGEEKSSLKEKHDLITFNINKAKKGEEVPVEFIIKLHPKNPFIKFVEIDTLFSVMETLGNGVHRIAITNNESTKIIGILSQRRLIKYMWENARRFPSLEFYLSSTLQDLKIGSNNPLTIYDDQPVLDALYKMFHENVSSLAVIDRGKTLIGNISIVDVRNLTSSKNSHLLYKPVLNFISYNLSQKGIEEGQDQFPIFHVNNQSSLGRVIAKLVATESHRLWVVDTSRKASSISSQSSSAPNSGINNNGVTAGYPLPADSNVLDKAASVEGTLMSNNNNGGGNNQRPNGSNSISSESSSSNSVNTSGVSLATNAVQQEQGYIGGTGKLIGVVTLTDILGLFANSKGRRTDPQSARNFRRRSSTSTTRSSMDSIDTTSLRQASIHNNSNNSVI
ncbi:SDS23 [Candida pseudojiufengensis]|uniref:SDS23 n=1 Tax=Candida pseudojiufengensis TaxID=497109 RepID=UPI002225AD8F|nr:SDS23 [Candida pseudojiufengensis]KAI5964602.1 SDS23 [Candida pseudojiufengensis]